MNVFLKRKKNLGIPYDAPRSITISSVTNFSLLFFSNILKFFFWLKSEQQKDGCNLDALKLLLSRNNY